MKVSHLYASLPWLAAVTAAQSALCPSSCVAGENELQWDQLHDLSMLTQCNETMLFATMLYQPIAAPDAVTRACTVEEDGAPQGAKFRRDLSAKRTPHTRRAVAASAADDDDCPADVELEHQTTNVTVLRWDTDADASHLATRSEALAAANAILDYAEGVIDCDKTLMFARRNKATVGLYVGPGAHHPSAQKVLRRFVDEVLADPTDDVPGRLAAQHCGWCMYERWTFSMFVDFRGNVTAVQEALAFTNWGDCFSKADNVDVWEKVDLAARPLPGPKDPNQHNETGVDKRQEEEDRPVCAQYPIPPWPPGIGSQ